MIIQPDYKSMWLGLYQLMSVDENEHIVDLMDSIRKLHTPKPLVKDETKNYHVYIDGRLKACVDTPEEAWTVIGQQPFGAGHMVSSPTGKDVYEFVPL